MGSVSTKAAKLQFPHLKVFADFILQYLHEAARVHTELIHSENLPLLKHFSHLSEDEMISNSYSSLQSFFTDLSKNDAINTSLREIELLKTNDHSTISKDQLSAEDFVIGYTIRFKLFHYFLDKYSFTAKQILGILNELQSFNSLVQAAGFRVYMEIKENELNRKNEDITRINHTISSERDLTQNVLDTSIDAIVAFDNDMRYIAWNKAMEDMSGLKKEKVIGKTPSEAFPELIDQKIEAYFRLTLAGENVYIEPVKYKQRPGYYEGYMAPMRDENGNITGGVSVVRDISVLKHKEMELSQAQEELEKRVLYRTLELERANRELKRINIELEDFAYTVSHDLKGPLRAISSIARFLATDYRPVLGPKGIHQLDLLINRAKRMGNLIEGILEYAKVGRDPEEKAIIALDDLAKSLKESIRIPDKQIDWKFGKLPSITAPKMKLHKVLHNLVQNALDFNDKSNPEIEIGSFVKDSQTVIYVKDNGPGIEEKYFEKIFRPFQTLTPRDVLESTGIGLALVKKIIELEEGNVWLESKPGKGSTFYFSLPGQS